MSKTQKLTKISILAAAAYLIMFIEFPLPLFPDFLKIGLSDVPALFSAFAFGPVFGVVVEAMKNILHLITKGSTSGIGELANFIVGSSLVYTAGALYKRDKTKKGAVISLIAGVLVMAVVASVTNYYIFLPLYEKVLGFPIKAVVEITSKVNKAVVDLNTLIVYSIMPFNLIKGTVASVVTFTLYKKLHSIIK
ncbi:ECF transporter S component [Thermobrachium celere]|uniref:ECF transporter S component n=1 Tax=Thermobrachium celere TaxID=53422 RepID=UPI0019445743|nr:ECF transporter S component [Thermobrachium celere]GFR35900.1 riboflavin transporter [Thermobrachium celere]